MTKKSVIGKIYEKSTSHLWLIFASIANAASCALFSITYVRPAIRGPFGMEISKGYDSLNQGYFFFLSLAILFFGLLSWALRKTRFGNYARRGISGVIVSLGLIAPFLGILITAITVPSSSRFASMHILYFDWILLSLGCLIGIIRLLGNFQNTISPLPAQGALRACALFAIFLAVPAVGAVTIDVSGRLTYEDPEWADSVRSVDPPLPGIAIQVREKDMGDEWFQFWDETLTNPDPVTNDNGEINVSVISSDPGGPDIYFHIPSLRSQLASGEFIAHAKASIQSAIYNNMKITTPVFPNRTSNLSIPVHVGAGADSNNIATITPSDSIVWWGAVALGEIHESAKWLKAIQSYVRDEIDVWVAEDFSFPNGSGYKAPNPTLPISGDWIQLETLNDESRADTYLSHEYGHGVMYTLHGSLVDGGFQGDHALYTISNPKFAMMEGWPTFYANAVHSDRAFAIQKNADGTDANMETNRWWYGEHANGTETSAENVEGAVMSIMWDLTDTDNADEEFSSMDGSGIHFDTFQNVWLPFGADPKPQTIRGFWDNLANSFTTPAEKTKIRGIFERNGVVLNREKVGASALPARTDTNLATHVIWGSANIATVAGPKPPVISSPVSIESRRFQMLKTPLKDTNNPVNQPTQDWITITQDLYTETQWVPNDVSTGFSSSTPTFSVYEHLGLTSATYAAKLDSEGTRLAIRVQDKLTGGARASFYPDLDRDSNIPEINQPAMYTSQWLEEQGTLRRVMLDNFAPFVSAVMIKTNGDMHYQARWPIALVSDSALADSAVTVDSAISDTIAWAIELEFSESMDTSVVPNVGVRFSSGSEDTFSGTATWLSDTRFKLVTDSDPFNGAGETGPAKLHISGAKDRAGTGLDGFPKTIAFRNESGVMQNQFHGGDLVHAIRVNSDSWNRLQVRFSNRDTALLILTGSAYVDTNAIRLSRFKSNVIPHFNDPYGQWGGMDWKESGAQIALARSDSSNQRDMRIGSLRLEGNEYQASDIHSPSFPTAGAFQIFTPVFGQGGEFVVPMAETSATQLLIDNQPFERIENLDNQIVYGDVNQAGRIVYTFAEGGIYLNPFQLLIPATFSQCRWSPDGQSILAAAGIGTAGIVRMFYLIDPSSGTLTGFAEASAASWRDSERIAFLELNEFAFDTLGNPFEVIRRGLFVRDLRTGDTRTVLGPQALPNGQDLAGREGVSHPACVWSPDGRAIAFLDSNLAISIVNPAPPGNEGRVEIPPHLFSELHTLRAITPIVDTGFDGTVTWFYRTDSEWHPVPASGDLTAVETSSKRIQFAFDLQKDPGSVGPSVLGYDFYFGSELTPANVSSASKRGSISSLAEAMVMRSFPAPVNLLGRCGLDSDLFDRNGFSMTLKEGFTISIDELKQARPLPLPGTVTRPWLWIVRQDTVVPWRRSTGPDGTRTASLMLGTGYLGGPVPYLPPMTDLAANHTTLVLIWWNEPPNQRNEGRERRMEEAIRSAGYRTFTAHGQMDYDRVMKEQSITHVVIVGHQGRALHNLPNRNVIGPIQFDYDVITEERAAERLKSEIRETF